MLKEGKFNRYLAPGVAVGLLMALGNTACGGGKADCLSPRAESQAYPGDYPRAQGRNPINWPDAIVVRTQVPAEADGVVLSFEVPGSDRWKNSGPMPPDKGDAVALRIGPSPVEFGTQIQAPAGSQLCEEDPQATFSQPEPFAKARDQSSGYEPDPKSWSYNK